MSDPVEEPEMYEAVIIGARYKLQEPQWATTIGQGNPPEALRLGDVAIPWNTPCTASLTCEYPAEMIGSTWHVRAEVIHEMTSQLDEQGKIVRQFKKLPS